MTELEKKEYNKTYYRANKAKAREYAIKFKNLNPEKTQEYNKKHWRKYHPEPILKTKEHRKEYMRNYMKIYNKKFPHIQRSKRLLNDVLRRFNKTKTSSTSDLLGYSSLDLKVHLENLGMVWELHQIDHKIPVSAFSTDTPMHIINDLRNLQPLTMEENIIKSNNYFTICDPEYITLIKPYLI